MVTYVDTVTKKNTGIICDLCGKISTRKFIYFSGRFDLVDVDCDRAATNTSQVDKRNLDLDACGDCVDALKKKMMEQISKRQSQGAWSTNTEKKQ